MVNAKILTVPNRLTIPVLFVTQASLSMLRTSASIVIPTAYSLPPPAAKSVLIAIFSIRKDSVLRCQRIASKLMHFPNSALSAKVDSRSINRNNANPTSPSMEPLFPTVLFRMMTSAWPAYPNFT